MLIRRLLHGMLPAAITGLAAAAILFIRITAGFRIPLGVSVAAAVLLHLVGILRGGRGPRGSRDGDGS